MRPVVEIKRRSGRSLSAYIGALERRLEHLQHRLKDPSRRSTSKDFDRAEATALEQAIDALERYRAEVILGVSTIGTLRALVAECEHFRERMPRDGTFVKALEDARTLLNEVDG